MSGKEKANLLMMDDQPANLLTYEAMLRDLDENLRPTQSWNPTLAHRTRKDGAPIYNRVGVVKRHE